MLKAYIVYNRHDGHGEMCFLVYAPSSGKARGHISRGGWGWGTDDFLDLVARRMPGFDQYAQRDTTHTIVTNDGLPPGVEFYDDSRFVLGDEEAEDE